MTKTYTKLEIAQVIFSVWGFDRENMDRILTALRARNTDRSHDIACSLEHVIDKEADEAGICPECFGEEFDVERHGDGWNEPVQWHHTCKKCGWGD